MGFFKKKDNTKVQSTSPSQTKENSSTNDLKTSLQENIQFVKDTLGKSSDIIIREIRIGKDGTMKAGIFYTDGLTDTPHCKILFWKRSC